MQNKVTIHLGAPFLFHGGAEKQFRYLLHVLEKDGYKIHVHVLSNSTPNSDSGGAKTSHFGTTYRYYGCDVLSLRRRPLIWLNVLAKIAWAMRSSDIVYFYSAYFIPLIPVLKLFGKTVIYSERILSDQVRGRQLLYRLAAMADHIVVNGDSLFDYFSERFDNVLLIRNRVDPIDWTSQRCESTSIDLRIAVIARFDPWKNIPFVLRSLGHDENLTITIYGSGLPSYQKQLHDVARECEATVSFASNTPIAEIYSMTDLIVHPSLAEGTPNVILEAMASRMSVIASDIRENLDTGLDDRSFFNPNDEVSLQEAVKRFSKQSALEREDILSRNQLVSRAQFDPVKHSQAVSELFQRYADRKT